MAALEVAKSEDLAVSKSIESSDYDNTFEIKVEDEEVIAGINTTITAPVVRLIAADDSEEYITDCPIVDQIKSEKSSYENESIENKSLPEGYEMYVIQGLSSASKQFIVKSACPKGLGQERGTNQQKLIDSRSSTDNCKTQPAKYVEIEENQNLISKEKTLNNIKSSATITNNTNNVNYKNVPYPSEQTGNSDTKHNGGYKKQNVVQSTTLNSIETSITTTSNNANNENVLCSLEKAEISSKRNFNSQENTFNNNETGITTTAISNYFHDYCFHDPLEQPILFPLEDSQSSKKRMFIVQKEIFINNNNKSSSETTPISPINNPPLAQDKSNLHSINSDHSYTNCNLDTVQKEVSLPAQDNQPSRSYNEEADLAIQGKVIISSNCITSNDFWFYDETEPHILTFANEGTENAFKNNQIDPIASDTSSASEIERFLKTNEKRCRIDKSKLRVTQNEQERNRRLRIKILINELETLLPATVTNVMYEKDCRNVKAYPKPDSVRNIIKRACDYIRSMQGTTERLRICLLENENLRIYNQYLQQKLDKNESVT